MIFNLIEGIYGDLASEKLMHTLFWKASGVKNFEVLACGGNQSLYSRFKEVVNSAAVGDAVFLAYDTINTTEAAGSALLDRLRDISINAKVPCYILGFDCFEMLLLCTDIPSYLLKYNIDWLTQKKVYNRQRDNIELLCLISVLKKAFAEGALAQLPVAELSAEYRMLATTNHFSGSLEQIIKRTCKMATRCGRRYFAYDAGSIGVCWYEDCDLVRRLLDQYPCNKDDWSDFNSPVCMPSADKILQIFKLLGISSVFNLYATYNDLALNCISTQKDGVYCFTPTAVNEYRKSILSEYNSNGGSVDATAPTDFFN